MKDETVWLSQKQMAELFDKDRKTITENIQNVFKEGDLDENLVCRKFQHTAKDDKTYNVSFYNLDIIISVGYRVKSLRGTQFRIWATQKLKEYIIKGFVMDDERLIEGRVEKHILKNGKKELEGLGFRKQIFIKKSGMFLPPVLIIILKPIMLNYFMLPCKTNSTMLLPVQPRQKLFLFAQTVKKKIWDLQTGMVKLLLVSKRKLQKIIWKSWKIIIKKN
ncbi:virulence RhuM family protein [Patescibacteria group bacterium]|nr:virulence RhuM family protein [Patescibacteria group bacterium]